MYNYMYIVNVVCNENRLKILKDVGMAAPKKSMSQYAGKTGMVEYIHQS